jgi:hypothetical protein
VALRPRLSPGVHSSACKRLQRRPGDRSGQEQQRLLIRLGLVTEPLRGAMVMCLAPVGSSQVCVGVRPTRRLPAVTCHAVPTETGSGSAAGSRHLRVRHRIELAPISAGTRRDRQTSTPSRANHSNVQHQTWRTPASGARSRAHGCGDRRGGGTCGTQRLHELLQLDQRHRGRFSGGAGSGGRGLEVSRIDLQPPRAFRRGDAARPARVAAHGRKVGVKCCIVRDIPQHQTIRSHATRPAICGVGELH